MRVYLVGGFVRDKLLGRDLSKSDKDYLVVGSSPEKMLKKGFKQVGKSFPVFLHPITGEEYALARKEIKMGLKHQDFYFEFTPDITLEEDLKRRDFTINAIAENKIGYLIDPFHGQKDLEKQCLRHISPHFDEDPLRILRACRFQATLGFSIAPETRELIQKMISRGDLQHISQERVLMELHKVFKEKKALEFERSMKDLGAWQVLFDDYTLDQLPSEREDFFFFYFMPKDIRKKFPLPKKTLKLIQALKFCHYKEPYKDALSIFDRLKAWRVEDYFFQDSLELLSLIHGPKWLRLNQLRNFVSQNISLHGMENFSGQDYGRELEKRRQNLINRFSDKDESIDRDTI